MSTIGTKENENLLTEKELETLKQIQKFKRDILSYLDLDQFIKQVIEIIEGAKLFAFRSATSKLTINKTKPVFVLKVKDAKLLKQLAAVEAKDDTGMKTLESLSIHLNDEIIKKVSEVLTESLKQHDNKIFADVPEDIKTFIISNIYSIRFSLEQNNIQLFYFF